jgi:hypothetical protein
MTERDVPLTPDDPWWVPVTDDLLASSEADQWRGLVESFEPTPHQAGREMAVWLCDAVQRETVPEETYAIRTSNELLGFFAVKRARVKLSFRALPLFELRKRVANREPQPGLILVSIARAASTPAGFGHVLFEHALGVALDTKDIVAIFVQPDNDEVAKMWRDSYKFRPMDDPETPGLLYFPVDPAPEANWP